MGPKCPHKTLMSKNLKKPRLHVRRYTIFPLKIGEEQEKDLHAARSLPSSGVEEFFYNFFLKFCYLQLGMCRKAKSNLPDIRQGAAAWLLPTIDLQQRSFAILFEDAFRRKSRKLFRFSSLKFIQKKLPKYRVKRSKK